MELGLRARSRSSPAQRRHRTRGRRGPGGGGRRVVIARAASAREGGSGAHRENPSRARAPRGLRRRDAGRDDTDREVAKAFGGADILINNAGAGSTDRDGRARREMGRLLGSARHGGGQGSRAPRAVMKKRAAASSSTPPRSARRSLCGTSRSTHTKAALMMFSKTLSTELIGDNIRVNCVNPGLILTPTGSRPPSSSPPTRAATGQAYLAASPTNTRDQALRQPEELANFYVFLCSERAATASARAISSTAACEDV